MERYREPFKNPEDRIPTWRWPNEIPIAGEPEDVAEAVEHYHRRLQESEIPKLLFYGSPGALISEQMVEWCEANLKNLQTVNLGEGLHFLQEDHPHRIGSELTRWYQSL